MAENLATEKFPVMWRHVVRRNWWVYRKFLLSRFIWNLFAPTVTLLAFGLGVGSLISANNVTIDGISGFSYLTFITPGLIIFTTCFVASGDTTYGSFIRFDFQKTFDAQVSTPVSVRDLILGEVLYATFASEIACLGMLIVAFILGAPLSPLFIITPIFALLGALTFACQGILVTSYSGKIENFSYYFEGFLIPMQFLSGAFFSLSLLPAPLRFVAQLVPLTWVINVTRNLFIGVIDPVQIVFTVFYCFLISIITFYLAKRKFFKRMML